MFSRHFFIAIGLVLSLSVFAQKANNTKTSQLAKTTCDCEKAINININKVTTYGPTQPPYGGGSINEIGINIQSGKFNFEAEHNSAWYLLNMNFDGEFVFEIAPQDSSNDYDFLFYKYTDTNFCKALEKKQAKPVRSNLSRQKVELKGITGLSSVANIEFVGRGVQSPWSKSIVVAKGEKYMLVLDNVYQKGSGHTIKFNYLKKVAISGAVTGSNNKPLKADIVLSDNNGETIKEITTGEDGKYSFNTGVKEGADYTIAFISDKSFISTKNLNTNQLTGNSDKFASISTTLPELKQGEKYRLFSINFYGDVDILLPESTASVEALYKMMKRNPKMSIRIEGHINGGGTEKAPGWNQKLSELRAKTVANYLIKNGIQKQRLSTIGFSDTQMLYPNTKKESEASANRRVEINVLSLE